MSTVNEAIGANIQLPTLNSQHPGDRARRPDDSGTSTLGVRRSANMLIHALLIFFAAMTVVSIAPLMRLFLLLQKEIISGLTSGAVKG